jgi:hypothetical protein
MRSGPALQLRLPDRIMTAMAIRGHSRLRLESRQVLLQRSQSSLFPTQLTVPVPLCDPAPIRYEPMLNSYRTKSSCSEISQCFFGFD